MSSFIYIFYPFLSGLFPILFLWTKNLVEVSFSKFLKCASIYTLAFCLIWFFLSIFIIDTSVLGFNMFLIVVLFYKSGRMIKKILYPKQILDRIKNLFFLGSIISGFWLRSSEMLSYIAWGMGGVLSLITVILILKDICFFVQNKSSQKSESTDKVNSDIDTSDFPDIYFLMPDGYGNQHILEDTLGYDNSDFITFLKNKKFHIVDRAICNYTFTEASMGSTLNMDYIDNFFKIDENLSYDMNMHNYLKNYVDNRLCKILQEYGYHFIHLLNQTEQGWGFVNRLGATEIYSKGLNEFEKVLLKNTLLGKLFVSYLDKVNREGMLKYFDHLEHISEYQDERPSFVYAHIFCPHPPFLFDEEGKIPPADLDWMVLEDNNQLYLKQLTYLNKRLKTVVENILNNGRSRKKVIIIQSDHGCCMHPDVVNNMDKKVWEQRRFVLRAIYSEKKLDFDFDSNVNLFRSIFNTYLGTNYTKLPDITYYSDNRILSNELFKFKDGNLFFSKDK